MRKFVWLRAPIIRLSIVVMKALVERMILLLTLTVSY